MKTFQNPRKRLAFVTTYNVILFAWDFVTKQPTWVYGILTANLVLNILVILMMKTEKENK